MTVHTGPWLDCVYKIKCDIVAWTRDVVPDRDIGMEDWDMDVMHLHSFFFTFQRAKCDRWIIVWNCGDVLLRRWDCGSDGELHLFSIHELSKWLSVFTYILISLIVISFFICLISTS